MIAQYTDKLKRGADLTAEEMGLVMGRIMSGQAGLEEMVDVLVALQDKGPTVAEIRAAADVMKKFCVPVSAASERIFDLVGTGGDHKNTFNISTIAALVVSSAGVVVAKHGNRAASSACGSADVLEALGVNLGLSTEALGLCLEEVGFAFLFARNLHPAMRHVAAARKVIGRPTIFNILGPLVNPASPTHQVLGVYSLDWVEPFIHVVRDMGLQRAVVVHGDGGMDEVTVTAKTQIAEWTGKEIRSYTLSPADYGIPYADEESLQGGDPAKNAAIVREILSGEKGPKRDTVVLNAGLGLYVAGEVKTIGSGIELAEHCIDSGAARKKLEDLVRFTNTGETI